jgi:hypothetical protein
MSSSKSLLPTLVDFEFVDLIMVDFVMNEDEEFLRHYAKNVI